MRKKLHIKEDIFLLQKINLLLQMICGRRNSDVTTSSAAED
jgi:hypothetical protein